MTFFTREQCHSRLRLQIAAGRPIIGGGALIAVPTPDHFISFLHRRHSRRASLLF